MKQRKYGVALMVLLIFVLSYTGYRWWTMSQVERSLAAAEELGEPMSPEALEASYPAVPPDENAAAMYEVAFSYFAYHQDDTDLPLVGVVDMPTPGARLPQEMVEGIAACLERNAHALQYIHEATPLERRT